MHGHGKVTFPSGHKYEGGFENGIMHGRGVMKFDSGDVCTYDGEWKEGDMHGKAVIKYVNGDVFEGEMENSKRSGPGKLTCANGDVFEGHFKLDLQEGAGNLKCRNGDTYFGGWRRGQRTGKGFFKFSDGGIFAGDWKADVLEAMDFQSNDAVDNGEPAEPIGASRTNDAKSNKLSVNDLYAVVPPSFYCPIGYDIMKDPVICADGQTYERSNILKWLEKSDRSPKTNQALSHKDMAPNYALRSAIEEFHELLFKLKLSKC